MKCKVLCIDPGIVLKTCVGVVAMQQRGIGEELRWGRCGRTYSPTQPQIPIFSQLVYSSLWWCGGGDSVSRERLFVASCFILTIPQFPPILAILPLPCLRVDNTRFCFFQEG